MAYNRLAQVTQYIIEAGVVESTGELLREYGARGCEGLVLWLGRVDGTKATVTAVVSPAQESIEGEEGIGYFVTGETLFDLNVTLNETGLRLLAQVHSHPGEAYHSVTDDAFAIVTEEGGLSLVVPDFAYGPDDMSTWAAYRLIGGSWLRLEPADFTKLVYLSCEP